MEVDIRGAKILGVFENVPLLGRVEITQTLVVSWLVMALFSGLCLWLGAGLKVHSISRKQAAAELIFTGLTNFVQRNMGAGAGAYIPLVGTIFGLSLLSNLISLLGLWSPTADLMTPLAWGLVVFVLIVRRKIRSAGLKAYLKGFLQPIFVLAPVNVLSECFTPVSMACRHFGNILSGTVISALIYAALIQGRGALFPLLDSPPAAGLLLAGGLILAFWGRSGKSRAALASGVISIVLGCYAALTWLGLSFPWLTIGVPALAGLYFDWFTGFIQAFIFCTLTTLFLKQAAG